MTSVDRCGVDTPPDTILFRLLAHAGLRCRPLNRASPRAGHWILDCPRCHATDAVWIWPGGAVLNTTCQCWPEPGDCVALYHLLYHKDG